MRRFLHNNGLSLVLLTIFVLCLAGQVLTGRAEFNEERQQHGQPTATLGEYLLSGHFMEATFENWESEFLQMAAYVLFTAFLCQRGSAESKDCDEIDAPRPYQIRRETPWPVKRGGFVLRVYEQSLSLAFAGLFLLSFAMHAIGGSREFNADRLAHGESPASLIDYIMSSRFWFESFQNWQSEFVSVAAIVLLSIWLRQKGSPESKPVDAPHAQTGA